MPEPTRRTRPVPTRTEPNRSWTQTFNRPGRSRNESSEADSASAGNASGPEPDARETTYNSVNNAYRVIDEYLRRGQRIAEDVWLPSQARSGSGDEAMYAPARLLRAMGDMTIAWLEVMQQSVGGAPGQPGAGPVGSAGPFGAGKTPARPAGPAEHAQQGTAAVGSPLKVSVQSSGRVEVSVEVTGRPEPRNLMATELRCLSSDTSLVTGIEVADSAISASATLRIVVPEGQPPGIYNGLLLEREGQRPCGTISLSIL